MSRQIKHTYEFDSFRLDIAECVLLSDGKPVPLKPKAFEMLSVLVENNGHMLEKEELMRRLWPDSLVEEANLTVNISQLRKVLGQNGKGEQYIQTIPKRGYRFVAAVRQVSSQSPDLIVRERTRAHIVIEEEETGDEDVSRTLEWSRLSKTETAPPRSLPSSIVSRSKLARYRAKRFAVAGATLAVVAAITITTYFVRQSRSPGVRIPAKTSTLAILPFRNLKPDPETNFLGPSLADAIVNKLGNLRTLSVSPSAYVQKYDNRDVDPRAVARELGVEKLMMGSFVKDGDDLRVTAQLIDVGQGTILWRDTIDLKYDRLPTMENRVAEQIIKELQLSLSPTESEGMKTDAPQNSRAYEAFLRGRFLISSKEHATAIRLLEESTTLDPNYALAWTYLGKAYSVSASQYFGGREFHDKAKVAYDRALALNPRQPETRVLLANFLTENNRVEEAVPILRAVIDDNPNHSFARWQLSYAYRYAGMLDESIKEGENALQISPHLTGHLFNSYLYAGQYEKFLNNLPMRDEAYVIFYRGLGHYYLHDWTQAALYFDRAAQLDPTALVSQIGSALKLGIEGHNREGIEVLKAAEKKLEKDPAGDGELSYKLAQSYSALNDQESALRLLQKSIEQGFFCYPYFTSDPLMNPLRGTVQYSALIEQTRQRHEQFKRRFF
jgi:DNA-binding winged helix-turn-helix (wHTH) protein/TolB-like protein